MKSKYSFSYYNYEPFDILYSLFLLYINYFVHSLFTRGKVQRDLRGLEAVNL